MRTRSGLAGPNLKGTVREPMATSDWIFYAWFSQPATWLCSFLIWLTARPWRWKWHVPLKCHALSKLLSITTWKTVLFRWLTSISPLHKALRYNSHAWHPVSIHRCVLRSSSFNKLIGYIGIVTVQSRCILRFGRRPLTLSRAGKNTAEGYRLHSGNS
jgi:hypothetical protein